MLLSELETGCKGIIEGNCLLGRMRRRMLELGFFEGSLVECVGESVFRSPRAYLVKGTVLALRNDDACKIYIKAATNV